MSFQIEVRDDAGTPAETIRTVTVMDKVYKGTDLFLKGEDGLLYESVQYGAYCVQVPAVAAPEPAFDPDEAANGGTVEGDAAPVIREDEPEVAAEELGNDGDVTAAA